MVVLEDFWNFYPETWGNDPAYFSVGWFNHQLESVIFLAKKMEAVSLGMELGRGVTVRWGN